MTRKKLGTKRDQDDWDFANAESRPAVKNPRVVFSVAFRGADFDAVEVAAERAGEKVSEFIRVAAIARARPPADTEAEVYFYGASRGTVATASLSSSKSVLTPHMVHVEEPEYVTS